MSADADAPLLSLTALNAEIHNCIHELNALVYMRLELDREDARFRDLVQQHIALKEVREEMVAALERQLAAFDEQFGAAPRTFFASMYEDLSREAPAGDVRHWPVPPPFEPIVARPAAQKHKWYCAVDAGLHAVRTYTRRHYFVPRLRRASAARELAALKLRMRETQDMARLGVMLEHFKASNAELERSIQALRSELASPTDVFESVPAYCEFARAARRYFCDKAQLAARAALPPADASLAGLCEVGEAPQAPRAARAPPAPPACGLFKSFKEHHGVEFNCESWAGMNDDVAVAVANANLNADARRSLASASPDNGQDALFSPPTPASRDAKP